VLIHGTDSEASSSAFVVKSPLQMHLENGHTVDREVYVATDVEIGQIGCLMFFEMRSLLREKGQDVQVDFARPISTFLELEYDNDTPRSSPTRTLVHMERVIQGEWKKYLHQFGHLLGNTNDNVGLLASCFCHFSYVWSEGKLVVVDIQGSSSCFTDVAFHTLDGNSGPADFGKNGMTSCALTHKCNKYCKALGIDDHRFETLLSQNSKKKREETLKSGIPQSAMLNQYNKFLESHSKSASLNSGYVPFLLPMVTSTAMSWAEQPPEATVLNTAYFSSAKQ